MKKILYILLVIFQYQSFFGQEDAIHISDDKLYGELINGLPVRDSLVEFKLNDTIVGFGAVAVSKYGVSDLKVGFWKEYYKNGHLKMEGDYRLGSYIGCCTSGPCRSFNYYRSGIWKFYNEEGEMIYELNFVPTELHIATTCRGGDNYLFGIIKVVPIKYRNEITSDKIFEIQKIRVEDEYSIHTSTPLNGQIYFETKYKY
ncbi:hypothetical protein JBL43_02600 [Aureibaculum sp. A20]|uniref:Uncharacterized protein n=1 Tax=Aureibaculum flavum TaxID=2795986 RepID=A0ABS0WMD4_9FLAO|nr:hypothetical protein [Aureibaculum flavum]MBJ2173111.1 hypothetical protein [Aureibaculum flavum]